MPTRSPYVPHWRHPRRDRAVHSHGFDMESDGEGGQQLLCHIGLHKCDTPDHSLFTIRSAIHQHNRTPEKHTCIIWKCCNLSPYRES